MNDERDRREGEVPEKAADEATPAEGAASDVARDDSRTGDLPGVPPPAARPPTDDDALLAECRVETFRAGGPGGQHQNRTESGVRLTHLPTGVTATARESRSQHRNRKTALARLRAALEELARPEKPRIPTRVPERAKKRRVEEKRRRSEVKRRRRKPDPDE